MKISKVNQRWEAGVEKVAMKQSLVDNTIRISQDVCLDKIVFNEMEPKGNWDLMNHVYLKSQEFYFSMPYYVIKNDQGKEQMEFARSIGFFRTELSLQNLNKEYALKIIRKYIHDQYHQSRAVEMKKVVLKVLDKPQESLDGRLLNVLLITGTMYYLEREEILKKDG